MATQVSLIPQRSVRELNSVLARGRDQWEFLAEASVLLDAADNLDDVLAMALRAAVPRFADICVIRLSGDQTQRTVPAGLARPEFMEVFRHITPREESWDGNGQLDLKQRFGSALLTEMNEITLRRIARDAANLAQWRALAATTAITVPITHCGRGFGRIHFITTGLSGRRYRPRDLMCARDFTFRLASAVERALRHERLRQAVASMHAIVHREGVGSPSRRWFRRVRWCSVSATPDEEYPARISTASSSPSGERVMTDRGTASVSRSRRPRSKRSAASFGARPWLARVPPSR